MYITILVPPFLIISISNVYYFSILIQLLLFCTFDTTRPTFNQVNYSVRPAEAVIIIIDCRSTHTAYHCTYYFINMILAIVCGQQMNDTTCFTYTDTSVRRIHIRNGLNTAALNK